MHVSYTTLKPAGPRGFPSAPSLKELDVREDTMDTFPADVFHGLTKVANALSSN